ncbi:MAG: DinB family protein [Gammaproteobacteria bacterium]
MDTTLARPKQMDTLTPHYQVLAQYNRWMNERVFAACTALPDDELRQDVGAFFGSVIGTLNHALVGDMIWLQRFAGHPRRYVALRDIANEPLLNQLDKRLHNQFAALSRARSDLDQLIVAMCRDFKDTDFATGLCYTDTEGERMTRNFGLLVQHFFNHQTHHRGQVTTMLSQKGIDIGVTDLLALIPRI